MVWGSIAGESASAAAGNREVAKINTITDATHIVLDELVLAHESGSIVVKLECPYHIKRYMELEAAIAVGLQAVGKTYTFNASYGLGDFNVVKGVPYTHWRETIVQNIKERNALQSKVKPRPCIMV